MEGPLIFDASALFNFGHRDGLEKLLGKLHEAFKLLVTPEVQEQTLKKITYRAYYEKLIEQHFTVKAGTPATKLSDSIAEMTKRLGNADASVIVLALAMQGTVVIDDKLARREARSLKARITGSLGVLRYALGKNWISDGELRPAIDALRINGFRIPPFKGNQSFDEYLQSLGE